MKGGVTILNSNPALTREGRIYVLNANQKFDFPQITSSMTTAEWNTFAADLKAHPHTKCYSADDFATPRTFVCHPANHPAYYEYQNWLGTQTGTDFAKHFSVFPGTTASGGFSHRPMSTIAILVDVTSSAQSYTVSARANFYTRWPIDSIMGQSMKDVPLAEVKQVNAHHNAATAAAGMAR
jgi:hypothetical protein